MTFSRIISTGSYLPEKRLTNFDLEKTLDTTDAWIQERTGIRERRIAAPDETAATMGIAAAQAALTTAQIDANQLDMIIVATGTPDYIFPNTACLIQKALNITSQCPAFDLNAACAGFNYALAAADHAIRLGQATRVLVVGTELMSRILDWTDRSTCILFGDGAGAVILEAGDIPGILSTHLHADGRFSDLLYTHGLFPDQKKNVFCPMVHMAGREVFKLAVEYLGQILEETLMANNINQSEIDWLVPHQANLRIIQATAKRLHLPLSQVLITLDVHGNTSSASIPLCLDAGIRAGKIHRGQLLLLESFGGGITWGSALVRY